MRDFQEKVKNYILENHLLEMKDTCIVALSGGADSVCLLDVLASIREEMDLTIIAVHVNHMIRGSEADRDEEFVRSLCESYKIKCRIFSENIPKLSKESGESEEECGRRIRYELLNTVANEYKNGKIAVAHHMNDQVETVLFRMARGTGIKGIAGMKNKNGNIIRPLLCVQRSDIEEYLKTRKLMYVIDGTNANLEYSRNYIRNKVIPDLTYINNEAIEHINDLSNIAGEMEDYISLLAQRIINKARIEAGKYNTDIINSEDEFLAQYVIRMIFTENNISLKDVTKDHIRAIKEILKGTEYKSLDLPRGIKIIKEANTLRITDDINENIANIKEQKIEIGINKLSDNSKLECKLLEEFDLKDIPRNTYTKWFDYDKISDVLCVRNRHEKDSIIINEAGAHKKLKEYFINEKILKSQRDSVKLLADGSEIIWVIGYRIAANVKVTETTKRVLEISYHSC